jgi:hypothetical protein
MKPTFISLLILTSSLLVGCSSSTLVQIADVESTNCRLNNNFLLFENDTLRVVYVFWGYNGVMGIFIHNKTEFPLYIDWKKCSFITGSTKHDYWDESTAITTNSESSTFGGAQTKASSSVDYWFTNFLNGLTSVTGKQTGKSSTEWSQQTFSNYVTRIDKPERITFIPPHTTISQAAYNLVPVGYTLPPSYQKSSKDTSYYVDNYYIKFKMLIANFTSSNSPIAFRSFITYAMDEKFSVEHYLDSKFYVSRIMELPEAAFNGQLNANSDGTNKPNMWASPNSFYMFTESGLK